MSKETIGPKIKKIRKENNLTQDEFAESLGYSGKSVISHIEKGDVDMTYEKMLLLLKTYKIDANKLFEAEDKKELNKKPKCVFCNLKKEEIIAENELAIAVKDIHPASKGHTLIIPKRHSTHYFELTSKEMSKMFELSLEVKKMLDEEYHPDGYNVGFNVLEPGGQSIMHTHMHVIPRYIGDSPIVKGGIRHTVKIKDIGGH